MILTFVKYTLIVYTFLAAVFVYNKLAERRERRKEIEEINKHLAKFGKKPFDYK